MKNNLKKEIYLIRHPHYPENLRYAHLGTEPKGRFRQSEENPIDKWWFESNRGYSRIKLGTLFRKNCKVFVTDFYNINWCQIF